MSISFHEKVVIVIAADGGLGRGQALAKASASGH
jgi:hypothetical protein